MNDNFTIIKGRKDKLTKEEINFFDWVHEVWEHHRYDLKVVAWNDKKIRELFKEYNIKDRHDTLNNPIDVCSSSLNEIQFKCKNGKVAKKFIGHLRNSYSHLYFKKTSLSDNIHLQDWNIIDRETSAYGCTMDMVIPFEFLKKSLNLF